MNNLTLLIPAKKEAQCLPVVLNSISHLACKKYVIIEKSDTETYEAIRELNCEILFQSGKGYGNALITGIDNAKTDYVCIFNADGSFDEKSLTGMLDLAEKKFDFVFASRYQDEGGSDDDTKLTFIGNKFFSLLGKFFFSLKINDILYTYVLGRTKAFKKLELNSQDFRLCVEIPIKVGKKKFNYINIPSFEKKRLFGEKKVNEFKDGFTILIYMILSFLKS